MLGTSVRRQRARPHISRGPAVPHPVPHTRVHHGDAAGPQVSPWPMVSYHLACGPMSRAYGTNFPGLRYHIPCLPPCTLTNKVSLGLAPRVWSSFHANKLTCASNSGVSREFLLLSMLELKGPHPPVPECCDQIGVRAHPFLLRLIVWAKSASILHRAREPQAVPARLDYVNFESASICQLFLKPE